MARRSKSIETISHRQVKNAAKGSHKTHPIKDKKMRYDLISYFENRWKTAKSVSKRSIYYRDFMIVLTALYTAFRAEDLLQLQVKDVNKGMVDIKENKTGKEQFFKLPSEYLQFVNEYITSNGLKEDDYLFRSSKPGAIEAITRQRLDRVIAKGVDAVRIPFRVGMHGLRKTFGYCCITEWGYSPEDVRIFLNHSSTATTELYIEWGFEDVDKLRSNVSYFGRNQR